MREALIQVLSDGKRRKVVDLMDLVSARVGRQVYGSEITRTMDVLWGEGKITRQGTLKKG